MTKYTPKVPKCKKVLSGHHYFEYVEDVNRPYEYQENRLVKKISQWDMKHFRICVFCGFVIDDIEDEKEYKKYMNTKYD